jgi:transposase InsO family protein/transposase-like protein
VKKRQKSKKGKAATGKRPPHNYPHEYKLKAVKMHLEDGTPQYKVAKQMGCCLSAMVRWVALYQKDGPAGLADGRGKGVRGKAKIPAPVREKIVDMKQAEPELGTHKISNFLRRVFFMKASHETVRRVLHQESLLPDRAKPKKHAVVRRTPEEIEDGRSYVKGPHLMWQSDISVFSWQKQNVYLIGFMDDYSRFVPGLGVYLSQKTDHVLETFRRATMEYKAPKEMLTDNGRQYTSWRGRSEFEKEMSRAQIRHIRSRPHHPETQGKIERFWKTIKEEFLNRTLFAGFEDLQERTRLWLQYYNFRRPHQGIGGLCPADRFYEVSQDVRRVVEQGIADNVLQMALLGIPRKPCYLVGRMENQSVTVMAEKGQLKLQVSDLGTQHRQEIVYPLPANHAKSNIIEGDAPYGKAEREDEQQTLHIEFGNSGGPVPSSVVGVDGEAEALGSVQGADRTMDSTSPMADASDGGDVAGAGTSGELGKGPGFKSEAASSSGDAGEKPIEPDTGGPDATTAGTATGGGGREDIENGTEHNGTFETIHKGVVNGTGGETGANHSGGSERPDDGRGRSEGALGLPEDVLPVGEERASGSFGSASEWGRRPACRTRGRGEGGPEEGSCPAETGVVCGPGIPPCPAGAGCLRGAA